MTTLHRRTVLTAGLVGAGIATTAASTTPTLAVPASQTATLTPKLPTSADATLPLQRALDAAAKTGHTITLPAGSFTVSSVKIPSGTTLRGVRGRTVITTTGAASAILIAENTIDVTIQDIILDGRSTAPNGIRATGVTRLALDRVTVRDTANIAIDLQACSGHVTHCTVLDSANTALLSNNAAGLAITGNTIERSGNNAILVWRDNPGNDNTQVSGNRIATVSARSGGSGQNGNGINVFRADGVQITANHITDCAYTAIRANSSSNVQIVSNTCHRLGEVAIYAEFAFEGALIASNLIDHAATGISVTNFNDGGRLAVIQGNLIRNLFRREHEPVDKRGIGIFAEADSAITGNTIERASEAGIVVGHQHYMRNCAITGNVIRASTYGILLTSDPAAGACMITGNLIADTKAGAIRAHDGGRTLGRDLATAPTTTDRIAISGNLAV